MAKADDPDRGSGGQGPHLGMGTNLGLVPAMHLMEEEEESGTKQNQTKVMD